MTAKQCVFNSLDRMKKGERFTGYGMTYKVKDITGELHYPDTMLRYVREYRRKTGRQIVNVDKKKSIYEVRSESHIF